MTIYELAKLNKSNGGLFFHRKSMKAAGETLRSFSIKSSKTDKNVVAVIRKSDGQSWNFSKETGRVIHGIVFTPKLDGLRKLVTA